METTLHRQLKERYADDPDRREVAVEGFRIDAVAGRRLIEVQSASLAAIRRKVRALLEGHRVLVVKPLAERTLIVRRERRGGPVVSRRYSPARGSLFDLFDELVYFVDVFPHPRLTLEVLLIEQEEHRLPARSRRWNRRHRVDDRFLLSVDREIELRSATDLAALLPPTLPDVFSTADLAREAGIPRWLAQKAAYCLRKTGAAEATGKTGNAWKYRLPQSAGDRTAA